MVNGPSNCQVWAKGEGFQEPFGASGLAKVRKYGTKIASIGRKSPTDLVGVLMVLCGRNSKGEVFRGPSSDAGKLQIWMKTALR
jgi:hypothetical protein